MVFSKGRKVFGKYFIIRYLPNLDKNCRFGIIVSNKISKKATARNKIKRRVREIIRKNLDNFGQNYDMIITVMSPVAELDFAGTMAELEAGLRKAHIIR